MPPKTSGDFWHTHQIFIYGQSTVTASSRLQPLKLFKNKYNKKLSDHNLNSEQPKSSSAWTTI